MSDNNGNKTSAGVLGALTEEGLDERERAALTAHELQRIRDEYENFAAENEKALKRVEERFGARVDASFARVTRQIESEHTRTRGEIAELRAQVIAGQIRDTEHELAREADATRRKVLEGEVDRLRVQLVEAKAAQEKLAATLQIIDVRTTGAFPVPVLPAGFPRPLQPMRGTLPSYDTIEFEDSKVIRQRLEEAHEQAKQNAAIAAKAADIGLEGARTDIQVTAENRRHRGRAIAGLLSIPIVVALIGLAGMLIQRSCNTLPPDKRLPIIDSEKP